MTMKNVLLTNSNYIKSITNMSENIPEKYLFAAINEAQEIDLRHVLGDSLLEKIKQLVVDQTINNEGNEIYKDILTKSQFFLAYDAMSNLVVILSYKLDTVGVYRTADENLTYATFREVQSMQEYYENKRDFFKLELQNFCLNNRSKLPELSDNDVHSIKSNLYSAESCGIFLGNARGRIIRKPDCWRR